MWSLMDVRRVIPTKIMQFSLAFFQRHIMMRIAFFQRNQMALNFISSRGVFQKIQKLSLLPPLLLRWQLVYEGFRPTEMHLKSTSKQSRIDPPKLTVASSPKEPVVLSWKIPFQSSGSGRSSGFRWRWKVRGDCPGAVTEWDDIILLSVGTILTLSLFCFLFRRFPTDKFNGKVGFTLNQDGRMQSLRKNVVDPDCETIEMVGSSIFVITVMYVRALRTLLE